MSTTAMIQTSNYYNILENKYFQQIKSKIDNSDFALDEKSHFKIKKIVIDNIIYYMVNYKKNYLNNENINELGYLRSLIFDENCNLLCFSPVKSSYKNKFFENNKNKQELIVEPLFEGTMINLFYDNRVNKWLISTKSTIGANINYFKNSINKSKTFKEMVDDAMNNDNIDLAKLNKDEVFSFVLQHPENRIVNLFNYPKLILIEKYRIQQNNINFLEMASLNSLIKFNFEFNIEYGPYNNDIQVPPNIMGCVIKNHVNNQRIKYRNPTFEYVKELRGNQPKLEYTYLQLRKNGRLREYLKWYPEHSNEMILFRDKIHKFNINLYNNYVGCYIKKVKPLKAYPFEYKNHMFELHEIYKKEKKTQRKSMQYPDIINYTNDLHESKLMFSLNYNFRNKKD